MELRDSDKIRIEVAGKFIYIDPEKVPTGEFVEMMMLQGAGNHAAAGQMMSVLLLNSIDREQLNQFSLIYYPFILQTWMEALIKNVLGVTEIGSEIDEIVARASGDDQSN